MMSLKIIYLQTHKPLLAWFQNQTMLFLEEPTYSIQLY